HAEELSHEFEQAGVPSAWIYHGTELEDRAEIFRRFREGEIKVLCSVTALTTGFDEPSASCLIVARPTRSEALHIQMDGRGLRPNEGKKDCLIFDHAGNHHRHGLPQDYEPPTLEEIEQRTAAKREDKDRKPSTCDECDAVMRARQRTCDECGAERELLSMVIVQDGKLVETDGALPAEVLESSEYKTQWLSEAKGYGEAKRYSPQFGAKMFSIKFGKYPSGFKIWDRNVKARECGPEVGRWIRNEFKRKKIASNAVAKKLTANLPVFNPASKRHVPGCGHGTEDYFSGTGQHYAQVRCRNCGHFKRWAGADEVIKAIGKPAA
ncbi:MAG: hypothetical protein HOH70_04780, partial [Halieaceae bacterium]|nr:hypothetical protein [Halieaceae bacterium]